MDERASKKVADGVRLYEMAMFTRTADRILQEAASLGDLDRNMYLEVLLLHARILLDFFVGKPQGDGVSAQHFFEDETQWTALSKTHCPYLKANRERINKKLAHLTYKGMTLDKNWDIEAIVLDITKAWALFLSSLPDETRAWFT